ncbi:type IV toxin-antitoxin system AbiEi family antitoxin domain-containing protein [Phytoactinopolyspora endophytica]|uniref:type IV toxin-antitoxin system AbiEi family antitoxin domain-containing protein n=1 Tax=Phytoactinopolyspora endophytica TaxID=1642495 RepID=UPI0013EE3CD2|nr:type IV toxin-antitoxin system AbiEi family antitoxin domain-containing protein [Phytoactinopolyspora endophytica]
MSARLSCLPGDVEDQLVLGDGLLTVERVRCAGITRPRISRLVRAGLLVRLARGVYASRESYDDALPWEAFALRSRAFTWACGPSAHAAGWSAVAIRGLPAIDPPPQKPIVVMPLGSGADTNSAFGEVREVALPPEHRTVVNGCPILTDSRVVADIARTGARDDALVLADAALAAGTTVEELRDVLNVQRFWPGVPEARWVVEHADAYAESALETLGRLTFIEYDLPVPISNAWIELGPIRYRPDHLLDDLWLIFEGDGDIKYNERLDAAAVVRQQREREWELRERGFEISRYGWSNARHHRRQLAERFRAVIAERTPRPQGCSWYRETRTYRQAA